MIKAYLYLKENAILIFLVLYFLFSIIINLLLDLDLLIPCLWKSCFGFECLSCGFTTSIIEILKGNFLIAWEINKLTFLIVPSLTFIFLKDLIRFYSKH
ncbi:MAG: DUF2752 domain-containing protein [Flavobacteriales bacterium]|nr:DUF2752 domain-containing protein [Flavobacteriales bacterium]